MRSFLSVVGVLACAGMIHSISTLGQGLDHLSRNLRRRAARQSENHGFRAMIDSSDSCFADSTFEVYNDSESFEDFPRRTRSQQQGSPLKIDLGAGILGADISPLSQSELPEQQQRLGLKPLRKRAPSTPISERLALKAPTSLPGRLSLKTAAAAASVVVAEPEIVQPEIVLPEIPSAVHPTVRVPEVMNNAVVWDRAELAKLNPAYAVPEVVAPLPAATATATPVLSKASALQTPAVIAERKAALDALVQGRKSEFLEKRAQFDTTFAQKKAVFQAEGGFDKNSLLGKYSSLLRKKSE